LDYGHEHQETQSKLKEDIGVNANILKPFFEKTLSLRPLPLEINN
jgi:hypothetical protein